MPAVLYLGLHAVDFAILHKSGSGNAWVSPQFQMTLREHDVRPVMAGKVHDSLTQTRPFFLILRSIDIDLAVLPFVYRYCLGFQSPDPTCKHQWRMDPLHAWRTHKGRSQR